MAAANLLASGTAPAGTLGGAQTQAPNPLATGYNPDTTNPGGYVYGIGPQTAFDTSKIGTGDAYMKQMQDAYYAQGAARLDPQMQQQQSGLEAQLANMGLTRGSEAWNNEMQRQAFNSNDAYAKLRNEAILNSGSEAQRLQGMNIASQTTQNTSLGQQFGQNLSQAQLANAGYGALQGNILTREGFRSQEQIAASNAAAQAATAAAQIASAEKISASNLAGQERMSAAGLTQQGKALDAQVAQYAAQNNLTKEAAAQALGISQATLAQQGSQFGQTLKQQQDAMNQSASQFGQTLKQQQDAMNQSASQFGQTLKQQQDAMAQSAAQFNKSYDLQTKAEQNRSDQAAAQLGMTGKQLDAQIAQYAEQNGLTREQMAQQLALAEAQQRTALEQTRIQSEATIAAANAAANATSGASANNAASQAAALAEQRRQFEANAARQSIFDPAILANLLRTSNPTATGTTGTTGTTPA